MMQYSPFGENMASPSTYILLVGSLVGLAASIISGYFFMATLFFGIISAHVLAQMAIICLTFIVGSLIGVLIGTGLGFETNESIMGVFMVFPGLFLGVPLVLCAPFLAIGALTAGSTIGLLYGIELFFSLDPSTTSEKKSEESARSEPGPLKPTELTAHSKQTTIAPNKTIPSDDMVVIMPGATPFGEQPAKKGYDAKFFAHTDTENADRWPSKSSSACYS